MSCSLKGTSKGSMIRIWYTWEGTNGIGGVSPQCCVCLLLYRRSTSRAWPFIFNRKMSSIKRIVIFHLLSPLLPRYLTPLLKNFTWSFLECPALSLSVPMQRRGLGRIKISLSSKWKILAPTFLSTLKWEKHHIVKVK